MSEDDRQLLKDGAEIALAVTSYIDAAQFEATKANWNTSVRILREAQGQLQTLISGWNARALAGRGGEGQ